MSSIDFGSRLDLFCDQDADTGTIIGNVTHNFSIVDTKGFEAIEFITVFASQGTDDATIDFTIEHSDTNDPMDFTEIDDDDYLGQSSDRTVVLSDYPISKDIIFKFGYSGNKRYVRGVFTVSNTVSIAGRGFNEIILLKPRKSPVLI